VQSDLFVSKSIFVRSIIPRKIAICPCPLSSILLRAVYTVNLWCHELVEHAMASKDMIRLPMSSQLNSSDPFDANFFASLCTSTGTEDTAARLSEAGMTVKLTVKTA